MLFGGAVLDLTDDDEAKAREEEEQAVAPWLEPDKYIRNDSSRRVHVLKSDGTLTCGRPLPVKYTILDDLPVSPRFCGGRF